MAPWSDLDVRALATTAATMLEFAASGFDFDRLEEVSFDAVAEHGGHLVKMMTREFADETSAGVTVEPLGLRKLKGFDAELDFVLLRP